jgi:hypothetical protein
MGSSHTPNWIPYFLSHISYHKGCSVQVYRHLSVQKVWGAYKPKPKCSSSYAALETLLYIPYKLKLTFGFLFYHVSHTFQFKWLMGTIMVVNDLETVFNFGAEDVIKSEESEILLVKCHNKVEYDVESEMGGLLALGELIMMKGCMFLDTNKNEESIMVTAKNKSDTDSIKKSNKVTTKLITVIVVEAISLLQFPMYNSQSYTWGKRVEMWDATDGGWKLIIGIVTYHQGYNLGQEDMGTGTVVQPQYWYRGTQIQIYMEIEEMAILMSYEFCQFYNQKLLAFQKGGILS